MAAYLHMIQILEDTKPLLSWFNLLLLHLFLDLNRCYGRLRALLLGLRLSKHNRYRILGLNSMCLHKVLSLCNIIDMSHTMVPGLDRLVLFVRDNDLLPGDKEVDGVAPEVGDWRDEVLKGRVVGVVHEKGADTEDEEGTLKS